MSFGDSHDYGPVVRYLPRSIEELPLYALARASQALRRDGLYDVERVLFETVQSFISAQRNGTAFEDDHALFVTADLLYELDRVAAGRDTDEAKHEAYYKWRQALFTKPPEEMT